MKAYHFLQENMTAASGAEKPWVVGEERTIEGEIVLCHRGYHSSPTPWDALRYAAGPILCLVEISDPEQADGSKQVSRTRKLVEARNINRELRIFACEQAEKALKLAKVEDKRSWAAIEVSRRYADDSATKEELAAARDAAWAAARDTARAGAWNAAWDAARAAAWAAAWSAARAAAWDAAWDAAKEDFNRRMDTLFAQVQV